MKRCVTAAVAALCLALSSSAVVASVTNWMMTIKPSGPALDQSGDTLSIGWRDGYTDGRDPGEPKLPSSPPAGGSMAYIVSSMPEGSSTLDLRSPFAVKPETKVWNLQAFYVDAGGGPIDPITLTFVDMGGFPYDQGAVLWIITSGGKWRFPPGDPIPMAGFSITVPGRPYPGETVQVIAEVPEPSSLVSLLCGLGGVVVGLRRRT